MRDKDLNFNEVLYFFVFRKQPPRYTDLEFDFHLLSIWLPAKLKFSHRHPRKSMFYKGLAK